MYRVLYIHNKQIQSHMIAGVRSFREAISDFIRETGFSEKDIYSITLLD
jgi:hypothetical protein